MIEVTHGNLNIKRYEDIDEMPVRNFFTLNDYALLGIEIGSSPDDINKKFNKLLMFLGEGKLPESLQEAKNMYQAFWNVQNHIHFPSMQYVCWIHSVDGVALTDLSHTNLSRIVKQLADNGLTIGTINDLVEELKKK